MAPISRRRLIKMGAALAAAPSLVRRLDAAQRPAGGRDGGTLEPAARAAVNPARHILLRGGTIITMDPAVGDFARGDVHIQGDLTIETGAKLTGGIRADSVAIAGEIAGNIDSAQKVELLSSGILEGDLKAGTLTVAAGSRMRGRVEFGWGEEHSETSTFSLGNRQVS